MCEKCIYIFFGGRIKKILATLFFLCGLSLLFCCRWCTTKKKWGQEGGNQKKRKKLLKNFIFMYHASVRPSLQAYIRYIKGEPLFSTKMRNHEEHCLDFFSGEEAPKDPRKWEKKENICDKDDAPTVVLKQDGDIFFDNFFGELIFFCRRQRLFINAGDNTKVMQLRVVIIWNKKAHLEEKIKTNKGKNSAENRKWLAPETRWNQWTHVNKSRLSDVYRIRSRKTF